MQRSIDGAGGIVHFATRQQVNVLFGVFAELKLLDQYKNPVWVIPHWVNVMFGYAQQ